jgi:hypothetical protein
VVRFLLFLRLALILCGAAISVGPAFACQCSATLFDFNTGWQAARLETDASTAIFEGTPEHFDVKWSVLSAKVGTWIPTESYGPNLADLPRMVVTFRVLRTYKGELGAETKIETGLGGGDCGAVYTPGLTYLIFVRSSPSGVPSVSMCSPGGWTGNEHRAIELRYLRKERPLAGDLTPPRRPDPKPYAAQEQQRKREYEEYLKRYAALTGEICGKVVAEDAKDGNAGVISFLFAGGFSPFEKPIANVGTDGSFCSGRLGPGKYFLYFNGHTGDELTYAAYYPGVSGREKAAPAEVHAGETLSGLMFKVPVEKTYSVRGLLSIYDSSKTGNHRTSIELVNLDAVSFPVMHRSNIDFETSSAFPKIKYFHFENVPPGRYTAYVSMLGLGWHTKKEEVIVTDHMKFISLELVHQK